MRDRSTHGNTKTKATIQGYNNGHYETEKKCEASLNQCFLNTKTHSRIKGDKTTTSRTKKGHITHTTNAHYTLDVALLTIRAVLDLHAGCNALDEAILVLVRQVLERAALRLRDEATSRRTPVSMKNAKISRMCCTKTVRATDILEASEPDLCDDRAKLARGGGNTVAPSSGSAWGTPPRG